MFNQYMPRRTLVVDESITGDHIHHQGEYLYATSKTFYKFFLSIWPFEKAFETCQALAMAEIDNFLENLGKTSKP